MSLIPVVDGQLREYAGKAGTHRGDLWIEGGAADRDSVRNSLEYLKKEGLLRRYSFKRQSNGDLKIDIDY